MITRHNLLITYLARLFFISNKTNIFFYFLLMIPVVVPKEIAKGKRNRSHQRLTTMWAKYLKTLRGNVKKT